LGAEILAVLTNGFGLYATRNAQPKPRSTEAEQPLCACDILVKATKGQGKRGWAAFTYNSAADVWNNRARLWKEMEVVRRVAPFDTFSIPLPAAAARGLLAELGAMDDKP
jgi:hypothetical protein